MEEQQEERSASKPIAKPAEEHHVPTWLLVIIAFLVGSAMAGALIYAWQETTTQDRLIKMQGEANKTIAELVDRLQAAQHALEMERESQSMQEEEGRFSVTDAVDGARVHLDDRWDLYMNDTLGFSIEIPRQVNDQGSCVTDAFDGEEQAMDDGDMTQKLLPTAVFSTTDGVYLSTAHRFTEDADGNCQRENLTARTVADANISQRILVHTIDLPDGVDEHADALDAFAREMYGDACAAGEISMQGDVTLEAVADADEECDVDFGYVFVYDEALDRAATFAIGQDVAWRDLNGNIYLPRNLTLR